MALHVPQGRGRHSHLADSLSRRENLEAALGEANAELAVATAEQDPFEAAFQAAHQTLLHADRTALTKPQLFALYDARMNAGHAWNPHRKRMRDATQWRGTVLRDLQAINLEIGE